MKIKNEKKEKITIDVQMQLGNVLRKCFLSEAKI